MPRNSSSADMPPALAHGRMALPRVHIDSYGLELRDEAGFVGDQASQTAFRILLENWRKRRRVRRGSDPLGKTPSHLISKKKLDQELHAPTASEASDVIGGAVEDFALALAQVVRRFLRHPKWRRVQRIVIGGGFPGSVVGERALLEAGVLLHDAAIPVELGRLRHAVDDGGLLGCLHFAPPELLTQYEAILAVDIGGTNVRCGVVKPNLAKAADFSRARVTRREKWRHAKDKPGREALLEGIATILQRLIDDCAARGLVLAPFIGIACPGRIRENGAIERGTQNMPGDWTADGFHLPTALAQRLPRIGAYAPEIQLHNDAVVQGLSELPFMQDVKHWAVLTIGTGLGNASFTNRPLKRK